MIKSCGVDLETIERFRRYEKPSDPFIKKVFTKREADYCFGKTDPFPSLCARFAAKEAVCKAFGGLGIELIISDVEIEKVKTGAVSAKILPKKTRQTGDYEIFLSLTHTDSVAMAFCILQGKN